MEKQYDIDFGGNILARIEIKDGVPTVLMCIDGYGYKVEKIIVTEVEKEPTQ